MEFAFCVAVMLSCLHVSLIFVMGSLSVVSSFFMDGISVGPLAHATSIMSGTTFQPFVMMALMSYWYFMIFLSRVSTANISLYYVNYMNRYRVEKSLLWENIEFMAAISFGLSHERLG